MNWEALTFQQLAYLDAVARHGHFGEAALDLGVSQPALSQGLARLEAIVGTELFVASGRRRVLTPAGITLANHAGSVITQSHTVAARIEARKRGKAGLLSVGMIDAAALYVLGDELRTFRAENPEVDLRITVDTSSALLQRLARGMLDVAIVVAPAQNFATIEVVQESLNVYAAGKGHTDEIGRWVLYPATSHTRATIDAAFALRGLRPNVEAESGNPSVLAQLARLRMGATVLPAGIAGPEPSGLLLVEKAIAVRTLVAAQRDGSRNDPLVGVFLSALGIA